MIKKYIGSRSCAILGLGVSNLPLARYLCESGIPLTVYDGKSLDALGDDARYLSEHGVRFVAGDKEFSNISEDVIFRSPGIRPDRSGLVSARQRGAEIISETELFLKLSPARTFGITGSDGKTTSTTLTGKFLDAQCKKSCIGNTYVGGNIGKPLLTSCEDMTEHDFAVLELSSFQLMSFKGRGTDAVAITNISPNHLDWHTDMNEYIRAKCNIIGTNTHRLVINAECGETLKIAKEYANRSDIQIILFSSVKKSFCEFIGLCNTENIIAVYESDGYITVSDKGKSTRVLDVSDINIPGRHNAENFMTAIGLTWSFVDIDIYTDVSKSFFGVEHRLELVTLKDGISYCNSSIDSSPSRTAAALSALDGKRIVLICGGYDKNIPYAPLGKAICEHGGVHTVVLTGATGNKIGYAIEEYRRTYGKGENIRLLRESDFAMAVELASQSAAKGDTVLLSPASASFDCFKNFSERGNTFKQLVKNL